MPTASYSVRYLALTTVSCCPVSLQFLHPTCALRCSLMLAHAIMVSRQEPYFAETSFLPEFFEFDDDDELFSPTSTNQRREHGKRMKREKAAKDQYLSPNEEKALSDCVLCMSQNGYPLAVKVLRCFALVIRRQREKASDAQNLSEPGKNWPQGFYKRNCRNEGLFALRPPVESLDSREYAQGTQSYAHEKSP
jgi:hypothetical protein